jgi:two-component system, NtrC family, nitrogen regulation response regulator NtrX
MSKILIIEDDSKIRAILREILEEKEHDVEEAADGIDGFKKLEGGTFDLCLCDIKMPKMDGMEVLEKAKEAAIATNFIIISAHGTIDVAVEAVKKGAFDFLQKPFDLGRLEITLRNASIKQRS